MLFRAQPDHRLSRASIVCGPHVRRVRECPIMGIMPVLRSLCQGRGQAPDRGEAGTPSAPNVHREHRASAHGLLRNGQRSSSPARIQGLCRSCDLQPGQKACTQLAQGKRKNKKGPAFGAFFIRFARCARYLKSSRSCTLALSVRSSTSTPLGGVNWKVPLPSMTSGMNLMKFTSLWLP